MMYRKWLNLSSVVFTLLLRVFRMQMRPGIFYFVKRVRRVKKQLPPTSKSLSHHSKRANYQACVWKRALVPLQNLPSPEGNGWQTEDGKLSPVLMARNPAPTGIIELAKCGCTTSECKKNCSCKKSELPCTEACLCMADKGCCNPLNENLVYYDDVYSDSDTE